MKSKEKKISNKIKNITFDFNEVIQTRTRNIKFLVSKCSMIVLVSMDLRWSEKI
jgi:uncharacterized FlaG/YvyC family protein